MTTREDESRKRDRPHRWRFSDFPHVPEAGETFVAMDTEKEARAFAETYISEGKNRLIEDTKAKMSLDDLFSPDSVR